jgi:ribosomal protein S18 acetylase RimI-like enzyme
MLGVDRRETSGVPRCRPLEIRVLGPEDWTVWRELRLAALEDAPSAFGSRLADWQGEGDREERWRSRLSIPGSHNVVAVRSGELVGMVSGVPGIRDGIIELISMWVKPGARGRGVGDHLIRAVERWALQTGAEVLQLAVMPANDQAIRLYLRNGFEATAELGDRTSDGAEREHVMSKTIGSG